METSVTKKGQTNIPAVIRKRHHIGEGDRLAWFDDGEVIRIVPIPKDPIKALRGAGQGEGLVKSLLRSRREEVEALATMSGMDLVDKEVMAGAWRT